jgi:phospholipid/cholesterol/gamma-HCH transport system substrate-binding protein
VQSVDPGRFRADVNGVVPIGNGFLYGGVRDLGETNRLNLQIGRPVGEQWSLRYGLYDGRVGVGLDEGLGLPDGWSLNLYHPNRLTLDLYRRNRLQDDTSLVYGVENLFRNPRPSIGVRLRR